MLPNKFFHSPTNVMEVMFEEFKDCYMVDKIPKPNNFINLECSYYLTAFYQVSSYKYSSLWEMSNISCVDPDRGTGGQDHPPSPEKLHRCRIS